MGALLPLAKKWQMCPADSPSVKCKWYDCNNHPAKHITHSKKDWSFHTTTAFYYTFSHWNRCGMCTVTNSWQATPCAPLAPLQSARTIVPPSKLPWVWQWAQDINIKHVPWNINNEQVNPKPKHMTHVSIKTPLHKVSPTWRWILHLAGKPLSPVWTQRQQVLNAHIHLDVDWSKVSHGDKGGQQVSAQQDTSAQWSEPDLWRTNEN